MHEQEAFWDYFWLAKFYLRSAGILPLGGTPSRWKSVLTKFLTASPLLYGSYVLIPEINYILFWNHNLDDVLEAVIMAITALGGQFRSIFIVVHRRKIARLFNVCRTLWESTSLADFKVVSLWARRARRFSTAYFCAAMSTITTFILTTVVRQLKSPTNSTMRYYPFHYPEDSTPSPQFEINYTLQVMVGYAGLLFVVAADMTGTLLALNMCGQFALIRSWLEDISKKEGIATRDNIENQEFVLKKCIRRHQVVMNFCIELEEVIHHINLVQIIIGMYVLAMTGARLMQTSGSVRYFGPLVLSISGLFFSCWPADSLFFASSEVAQAVYGVPWYRFSPGGRTGVAIMLMRSQRPAKLTAGKFVALSLELFSSIMSSSISFCMVLYRF